MGYVPDWNRQSFAKVKKLADGGQGLHDIESDEGLAPYGFRHAERAGDAIEVKGKGFYGNLPHKEGGSSTEISSDNGKYDYPLLVPSLTSDERQHLLDGKEPTDAIYEKAEAHAAKRMKAGKSAYAQPNELRFPKE
jgi:hypothetical protein